jgi:hypothetical protein
MIKGNAAKRFPHDTAPMEPWWRNGIRQKRPRPPLRGTFSRPREKGLRDRLGASRGRDHPTAFSGEMFSAT